METNKIGYILSSVRFCIIAALAVFIIVKLDSFSGKFSQFFGRMTKSGTEVRMLAEVIEEIRPIHELTTARYNAETLIDRHYASKSTFLSVPYTREGEAVFIVRGEVRAGVDLRSMTAESLAADGDTLYVLMPPVIIFDAIVNPSDIELFDQTGTIAPDAVFSFVPDAKNKLMSKAIEMGILEHARESAQATLSQIFISFGFKKVVFRDPSGPAPRLLPGTLSRD